MPEIAGRPETKTAAGRATWTDIASLPDKTRVPSLPEERPIRIVPDGIFEVLSPSDRRHDLLTKSDLYARFGVADYRVVDPEDRYLQARKRQNGAWLILGTCASGDKVRLEPFEAFEFDVARLFPPE